MSLQSRLATFIAAVGADIKQLQFKSRWHYGNGDPNVAVPTAEIGDWFFDRDGYGAIYRKTAINTWILIEQFVAVAPSTVNVDAWRTFGSAGNPTLAGSAIAGTPAPAFRKTPDGRVQLRGLINGSNGVLTTLPAGYRPSGVVSIPTTYWNAGTSSWLAARITVGADGVIRTVNNAEVVASLAYTQLDVIDFPIDQTTFPAGAYFPEDPSAFGTLPSTGWDTAIPLTTPATIPGLSYSFTAKGDRPVMVNWFASAQKDNSTTNRNIHARVRMNGTPVGNPDPSYYEPTLTLAGFAFMRGVISGSELLYPPPGACTIDVQGWADSTPAGVWWQYKRRLTVVEL